MHKKIRIAEFTNYNNVSYNDLKLSFEDFLFETELRSILQQSHFEILDLGCGHNPLALLLIKSNFNGHSYTGVDKSRIRVNYNDSKAVYDFIRAKRGLKKFVNHEDFYEFYEERILLRTDCNKFLIENTKKFDLILSIKLFHHIGIEKFQDAICKIKDCCGEETMLFFDILPNFNGQNHYESYMSILESTFDHSTTFIIGQPKERVLRIIFQNIVEM